MFKRAIIVSVSLILVVLGTALYLHIHIRSSDAVKYRKLVHESAELRSRKALERNPAEQTREGVQKDIYLVENGERLHLRIKSEYSHLTIHQRGGKVDAIEDLQHIKSLIQEGVDRKLSLQQVREIEAQSGIYTFPAHRFSAQAVHLAFYRLSGTDLPEHLNGERPYISGIAREAVFGGAMNGPNFTAYDLQAKFDPELGLP